MGLDSGSSRRGRLVGRGSGSALLRDVMDALKAGRMPEPGSYERLLHAVGGEVNLKVPKPDLRDAHYRALPSARELGLRSADRDVPGGDFGPAGRGHHRGAFGHTHVSPSTVEPEPEYLHQDRGLAEPVDRGRASVSLPRRRRHETQLGR
jgi:hypothetical protein